MAAARTRSGFLLAAAGAGALRARCISPGRATIRGLGRVIAAATATGGVALAGIRVPARLSARARADVAGGRRRDSGRGVGQHDPADDRRRPPARTRRRLLHDGISRRRAARQSCGRRACRGVGAPAIFLANGPLRVAWRRSGSGDGCRRSRTCCGRRTSGWGSSQRKADPARSRSGPRARTPGRTSDLFGLDRGSLYQQRRHRPAVTEATALRHPAGSREGRVGCGRVVGPRRNGRLVRV